MTGRTDDQGIALDQSFLQKRAFLENEFGGLCPDNRR